MTTRFEIRLNEITENGWRETLQKLTKSNMIHEVDQAATEVWFNFYPLGLFRFLEKAEDKEAAVRGFAMQNDFELATQIDSSHSFLWGHRYWADVKHATIERANSFEADTFDLEEETLLLARSVAKGVKQDESLLTGITLVAFMTLVQTGLEKFSVTSGDVAKTNGLLAKSPSKVIAERKKEKSGGLLGFLKTVDKEHEIYWDENDATAHFNIISDEELASAAARDQSKDWLAKDDRCGEGVIPVECRAAACGTCWVGVISGAENLSDVERLERKQMKVFGYRQEDKPKPRMRLACQARANGSATIVIPPWNGVYGKKVYGVEIAVLEPATTTAKKQREILADASTLTED